MARNMIDHKIPHAAGIEAGGNTTFEKDKKLLFDYDCQNKKQV